MPEGDAARSGSRASSPRIEERRALAPSTWAPFEATPSLYTSPRWLRVLEREPAAQTCYLVASDFTGKPLAVVPTSAWDRTAGWTPNAYDVAGPARLALNLSRDPEEWYPTVLVGTRAGYWNEPLGWDEDACATAVAAAFGRARRLNTPSAAAMFLTRRALGYVPAGNDIVRLLWAAGTRLDVVWGSFDEYVSSLKAHRRAAVKRDLRRFALSDCSLQVEPLSAIGHDAPRLLLNVQRKHGREASLESVRDYLAAQIDELDDRSAAFVVRRAGRPIAFALGFVHERQLFMRSVGVDYEEIRDDRSYFSMAFYAPIRYAVERGLTGIDLGLESYRPKLLRGARAYPLYVAIVPPVPYRDALVDRAGPFSRRMFAWWNQQLGPFAGALPEEEWLGGLGI
jgi:hypothetical protein